MVSTVSILVFVGFAGLIGAFISATVSRDKAKHDWFYELEAKRQEVRTLERSVEVIGQATRELREKSERVKLSRDVRILMDEWQPDEGTPLHWSLNWILEPA